MAKPPKWKMDKLDRREAVAVGEMQRRIREARREVAIIVASAARARKLIISGRNREKLYAQVGSVYAQLDLGLKDWGKDIIQKTAVDWHDAAIRDVREQTGVDPSNKVTRFSREYAEDVFKRVHPENGRSLAATLTDRMAQADIKSLRGAVTDVFREGSLTGKTMTEMAAGIKDRWDGLAGDLTANRFIDNAGRAWDDGRYMQMLVRTTVARVSRDSYFDTLTKNGDDLAVIQNADGEACDICAAWDEVIISITGSSKDYPSYNDALNAGWGHPNCRCTAERVDETIDKDAITEQAAAETPDFERLDGEKDSEYRTRVTEAVADYSKDFEIEGDSVQAVPPPAPTPPLEPQQLEPVKLKTTEEVRVFLTESLKEPRPIDYVKKATGSYAIKFRHPGTKHNAEAPFGRVDLSKSIPVESANEIANGFLKAQAECDKLGIPRLRGISVEKSGALSMGDGVLGVNPKNQTREYLALHTESKWTHGSAEPKPVLTGSFFKVEQQNEASIWHETGHHIHQQWGVKTIEDYRNPPLEKEIKTAWGNSGFGKNSASRYAETTKYWNGHEWFAENYVLAKMGRHDLLDKSAELRDILRKVGAL